MSTQRTILSAMLSKISLAEKPSEEHMRALSEILHTAYETGLIEYKFTPEEYIKIVKLGVLAARLDPEEIKLIKM